MGGLAAVLASALAVVITVVLVRPDHNSGNSSANNAGGNASDSEFASANDTGPVTIITEDPTCDAWIAITDKSTDVEKSVNWGDRDYKLPASSWTPEQRAEFETVGKALTQASDEAVNLVTKTPHRVMRILYEQYIAYVRAFVERIPSYSGEKDDKLVSALNGAGNALTNICEALTFRVASAISPLVPVVPSPSSIAVPDDPKAPTKLLGEPNTICPEWKSLGTKFDKDTEAWLSIDKNIPAKEWTPEQRTSNDDVVPIMLANADDMEKLGRQSGNPRIEDMATLGAQYRRAFAKRIPGYTASDGYLLLSATNVTRLVSAACQAVS